MALSTMLVSTLRSLASQPRSLDVDYVEFNRLLTGLYDNFFSTVERKKNASTFTIQVCDSFFLSF